MEEKSRVETQSDPTQMRASEVQEDSDCSPCADQHKRRAAVEMLGARLSGREREIYEAGMNAGSAQVLMELAKQHQMFIKALGSQAQQRQAKANELLGKLFGAAKMGAEVGRRLGGALRAVMGRD